MVPGRSLFGVTAVSSEVDKPVEVRRSWKDVWQVPTLLAAGLLLSAGVAAAFLTRSKPNMTDALKDSTVLLEAGKYAEALDSLNAKVLPSLNKGELSPDQTREFFVLRARSLYLGQKEQLVDREENHRSIVAQYREAENRNATLDPKDQAYMADALVSLGEYEEAVRRTEALPDAVRTMRTDLFKRMIDLSMRPQRPNPARAMDLLTALTADRELGAGDQLWALIRQSTLLVRQGFADDAISRIVRTLPRIDLSPANAEQRGELLVVLGQAYLSIGQEQEARRQVDIAASILGPEHRLFPAITLMRAEIEHQQGDLQAARERYLTVADKYSFADEVPEALLGLAEVESQIANQETSAAPDEAIRRYSQLAEMMRSGGRTPDASLRDRIYTSLLARAGEQMQKNEYATALQFGEIAEGLFKTDDLPAELLAILAHAHQELADRALRDLGLGEGLSLARADPATQREAKTHLLRAGDYFRMHASRVVQTDARAYADSVWACAIAFDRAGDLDGAISAFQQFIADLPGDTRHAEAMFRLAQCYRARGNMDLAAKLYSDLIAARAGTEAVGPLADASYVPLAQAYFADSDPSNDSRAEELLVRVVSGEQGGPSTPTFREALITLADHYHDTGRYPAAIQRFEQYIAAMGPDLDARKGAGVTYRLADAYRRCAAQIAEDLRKAMPDSERRDREKARTDRLVQAEHLYAGVKDALEQVRQRSAIEELFLRNAWFFQGDCAFDRNDHIDAIKCYEAARQRYPKDPASLVAMTQVVSSWLALGDRAKATVANARAKRFFESLPDSVWNDPTLPMTRESWQRWLDAQANLTRTVGAADDPGSN